jgi:uncharacterized protein YodC (DUF2158 family)
MENTVSSGEQWKQGDAVRLKSGGPNMTVEEVGGFSIGFGVRCVWLVNRKRESAVFKPYMLERVQEPIVADKTG